VVRVIEKSSTGIVFLTLTRTNYVKWSLVMMVNLQAVGLWEANGCGTTNYREDWNALAALLHAVLEEMQVGLACKETATDAWEAIWIVRMGRGPHQGGYNGQHLP
jgi:hypothetical protein